VLKTDEKLQYLFYPNEMPLGFINEIPDSCNLLIISHKPVINFWLKLEKKHKIKKLLP